MLARPVQDGAPGRWWLSVLLPSLLLATPGVATAAPGVASAAPEVTATTPPFEYRITLPSLRLNPGVVWYHTDHETLGRAAFTQDVELGARIVWARSRTKDRFADVLILFPVLGYSFTQHGHTPGHHFTAGLGFSMGMFTNLSLTTRFVVGEVGDRVFTGARADLELTLYYMVGLSVGYSALVGDGVHHGLRGLLTLDVGTLLSLLFIRR